jgi:hypothetical protein
MWPSPQTAGPDKRPLLIQAGWNGTEMARYYIKLSDPVWDAVLSEAASTNMFYPCNAGWYGAINIDYVNPPTIIIFDNVCQNYCVYILQGLDDAARSALFNTNWGKTGSERIFIDSFLPAPGKQSGNDIVISGANISAGYGNLLMGNPSPHSYIGNVKPFVQMPCVPCAQFSIDNNLFTSSAVPVPAGPMAGRLKLF